LSTTCSEYKAFQRRQAQRGDALWDYWRSFQGLNRRIDSLAQQFAYKVVNNAWKVVGEKNGAEWMKWWDMGDTHVCDECRRHSEGGRGGYYKITWFMPEMPVHPGCRCQWEIMFGDPFA